MAERLRKVPLWYKGASLITVASLAACQLGEKFGSVTPPPEGTQTNPTETVPPTEQLPIDINSISVEKGSFIGTVISGEVHIGAINQSETDAVWPKAERALFAIQSQENILPGTSYELKGLKIIDAGGHEQISFFADVNDGEKVFFYVETDQKGHFTPVNAQDGQAKGRMLRMDVWSDGVSSFLGFENGEEKLPVFELDGSNKVYYLDPYSGLMTELTQDQLPAGFGNYLASLKPVEPTEIPTPEVPAIPQEFLGQIPADKQYEIVNGQVLVDGKVWFELDNAGEWRKSDWKLIQDAPNQNFWEEKYKIGRSLRQDMWPVLNGENLEVVKEVNGQPVLIKGRLAVAPNPYQQGEILKVIIPYRFEWGDGLFINVWVTTKNEEKNTDYFLQLPTGEQVRIAAAIDSFHRPAECTFGTRCGWNYDIADLSADFFFNSITPDEPVIVSPVYIEVK